MQSFHNKILLVFKVMNSIAEKLMQLLSKLKLVLWRVYSLNHIRFLIPELGSLLHVFDQIVAILFLNFRGFKGNITDLLMKVLLGVEVEIIMFFAFVEELGLHPVLPFLNILPNFELLCA